MYLVSTYTQMQSIMLLLYCSVIDVLLKVMLIIGEIIGETVFEMVNITIMPSLQQQLADTSPQVLHTYVLYSNTFVSDTHSVTSNANYIK